MIRLKVDKQSEAMNAIKSHIPDIQNAANTAENQVAALRTAVETADKSLRLSRNITNYYDNVCQDFLSGFVGRMTHRENVQKETQAAIAWYQNQLQEVERVMQKLNVPETTAPPTPPPAAPCAQSPCQPSLRGRKPVNQQLLIVSSALPNQGTDDGTDEEADGETNQQPRFQNQKNAPEPKNARSENI
jgi:DNA-binding transcriptional regulator of glucitol operon